MSNILFEQGKTDAVSATFSAPATVTGYNLLPSQYEKDENGLTIAVYCGDEVTFEKVLTESDYDVDCHNKITSGGIRASAPLIDECGALIKLTACNNTVQVNGKGNYRAIYSGEGRYDAIVSKD